MPKHQTPSLRGRAGRGGGSRAGARFVGRDRVLTQLLEARRRRCVVVQGSAGSGKTALMEGWRQELVLLGFEVAWLSITAEDNDPVRLLEDLLASLGQVDMVMTQEAAVMIGRDADEEAVERIVVSLAQGIAQHARELVLVLDDLHEAQDARVLEALQWLLDYSPANLHLALVSRSAVPLSLARLRAHGEVLELDQRDLRFTLAETEQYLQVALGAIGRRDAQLLHELTDGWVAGLQLLTHQWERNRRSARESAESPVAFAHVYVQNDRTFAAYFEREVLSRLTPQELELELLVSVAACNRFCAPLCAALVGQPQAVADAVVLLDHLAHENLFVTRVDGEGSETWFRLNPLLRENLQLRLTDRSEPEQQRIRIAAWHWFRDNGLLEEAVRHAVLAGQAGEAVALVASSATRLVARGQLRTLIKLLRLLPAEEMQARVDLRMWSARLQLIARDLDGCARSLEQLTADIPPDDAYNRYQMDIVSVSLAVQRDDTDKAMLALPRLLNPPPEADALQLGARNNLLSWLYMHRGDYERARRIQLEATPLLLDGRVLIGGSAGSLQGRCLLGLSYAMEGQMKLAERVYRDVLREAESGGEACAEPGYLAAALLGEVLYEINDTEAARKLLEPRVDALERISIPDSVLRVMGVLASTHWLAGRHLESFTYLERLEDYSTKLGLDRLVAYSLSEQLHRYLEIQDFEKAESQLARLEQMYVRHEYASDGARASIAIAARYARIRWLLALDDFEGVAVCVAPLVALCEARGHRRLVAGLQLLQAVIDVRRGRDEAAREKLQTALWLGQRLGLVRSLLDVGPEALKLISRLADGEALDPVLRFYVGRLLEAGAPGTHASAAVSTDGALSLSGELDMLSTRELEVVHLLAQALPSKKIARTLGVSYQTVKWHLKNIYGKLGVSSRDEAVARVRDIQLSTGASASEASGQPSPGR